MEQMMDDILEQPIDEFSLDSMITPPSPSLDDMVGDKTITTGIKNRSAITSTSSIAAALSFDNDSGVVEAYHNINMELEQDGKSPTADLLIQNAVERTKNGDASIIGDILLDPTLPEEVKKKAVEQWNDSSNKMYDPKRMLAEAAARTVQPKNEAEEVHQTSVIESIDKMLDEREKVEEMLTHYAAKVDPGFIGDLAEASSFLLIPFMESSQVAKVSRGVLPDEGFVDSLSALWSQGSKKEEIISYLNGLPPDQLLNGHKKLFDSLDNWDLNFVTNSNKFGQIMLARQIIDGDYSGSETVVDNIISMLDVALLGGPLRIYKGLGSVASTQMSNIRAARTNSIRGRVSQTSVGKVFNDTNAEKARSAILDVVFKDETDQSAEALFQATRDDVAIVHTSPQIESPSGVVDHVVALESPEILEAEAEILASVKSLYSVGATEAEIASAVSKKREELEGVTGVVSRTNMFTVGANEDGSIRMSGVYGPLNVGFDDPQIAMDTVKNAFRNKGLKDEAFELVEQEAAHFTPSSVNPETKQVEKVEVGEVKSYLVRVKYDYNFSKSDVGKFDELDVKLNKTERNSVFAGNQNSLTRWLFDTASTQHPVVTGSASNAINKSSYINKQFLKIAESLTKRIVKLPRARQDLLLDIFEKANFLNKKPTYNNLKAAGVTDEEIGIIDSWGKYWDFEFRISNMDLVQTHKNRGDKILVDDNGTQLVVKPISPNSPLVNQNIKIYDHLTGEVRVADSAEIKQAYAQGGGLGSLDKGIVVDKKAAEYVLSKNTSSSYFKDITDETQLLNKLEAYMPVKYKDPYFVAKKFIDENGKYDSKFDRVFAVAGNSIDAERLARKLKSGHGGEFYWRGDNKDLEVGLAVYRDTGSLGRRSSQRARGQRLTTIDNGEYNTDKTYVMNPIDALVSSSKSLSNRIGTRAWIDNTKARFMDQYNEFLDRDLYDNINFPTDISQIHYKGRGQEDLNKLADARSTFNYIHTLEKGYVNLMDEWLKAGLENIAHTIGKVGINKINTNPNLADRLAKFEGKFIEASKTLKPVEFNRAVAFNLYLALNPLRQFVIQGHQAVQLTALYPKLAFKEIPILTTMLTIRQSGIKPPKWLLTKAGMTENEAEEFYKGFQRSGLIASIDNHNMTGASLSQLTELSLGESRATRSTFGAMRAITKASKKVGFDAGEFVAKTSAYAASYADKISRGGKHGKLTVKELDEIAANADNITLNMNRAGEMVYNQNTMSMFFQFQQAPHKMLMLMTTNRRLTRQQKNRLLLGNFIMYGVPSTFVLSYLQANDMPVTAEMTKGAVDIIYNRLLSLSLEGAGVDFQENLVPYKPGLFKVAKMMMEDPMVAFSQSPSMSLYFGNDPRLINLSRDMARYAGFWEDPLAGPVDGKAMIVDLLKLASGTSNAYKSYLMGAFDEKKDAKGNSLLQDVSVAQILGQVVGISTTAERQKYWADEQFFLQSSEFKEDQKKMFKEFNRVATNKGLSKDEFEYHSQLLAVVRKQCQFNETCNEQWSQMINSDEAKDWVNAAARFAGIVDEEVLKTGMRSQIKPGDVKAEKGLEDFFKFIEDQKQFGEEE